MTICVVVSRVVCSRSNPIATSIANRKKHRPRLQTVNERDFLRKCEYVESKKQERALSDN